MDTFTKKCSWGADTRSRAAGWGTPTGSARPRSCARGRCSGTGPSSRRRRSPRGLLPNSRRPPNHGQVGQSLQRFTTKIGRHAPRRCHCQRRRHAAASYRRWRGAAKGGLKPSLWSSSPFLTRERGRRRRRLWVPNFSSSTSLSIYMQWLFFCTVTSRGANWWSYGHHLLENDAYNMQKNALCTPTGRYYLRFSTT